MRLPDFFIIGAAKAGTTSLYAILDRHSQIFMPRMKEPEFFARDELYARGLESYAAQFAAARPEQVVGEASTLYTFVPLFPDAAKRVHRHAPDAKLIYIMREPVARAYSFYSQLVKSYQNHSHDYAVHRIFDEFVTPDAHAQSAPREKILSPSNAHLPDVPELCLAGSDYVAQIEAYLEHFDRDQMLFLKFEEFVRDRAAVLDRITDFLGLDRLDLAALQGRVATQNISREYYAQVGTARAMAQVGKVLGPLWTVRRLVPKPVRDRLRPVVAGLVDLPDTAHEPPPMQPETFATLQARFRPQRTRLTELTGLTFEEWDEKRDDVASMAAAS